MSRNKKVKNFKQYDSRWARVPYPRAPYYMADSGCGATACADIVVTNPKYKDKTPRDVAKFMIKRGYAIPDAGTAWAGITACLKHYGFSVTQHDDMGSFFKEMKKAGRMAIIVFRGGSSGGVTWTLGGHFLACSGMEIKNGQHRLCMLDVGPRGNTGWFTYEKHMKGLVAQLWTCYLPEQKKTVKKKAVGKVKKKPMKDLVAYGKKRAKEKHKYGRKRPMSWNTHFDCHWFTRNVYKDCGYPKIYKRISGDFWRRPDGKAHLGPYLVQRKEAGLDKAKLRAGDIVVRKLASGTGYHSAIYIGDGKVAETTGTAKGGRGTHIGKLTKKYIMAFRIPEPYKATYKVVKKRTLRKKFRKKSEKLAVWDAGTKFKCNYRRGYWVHAYRVFDEITEKWVKCNGWVCVKGETGTKCKKVKTEG